MNLLKAVVTYIAYQKTLGKPFISNEQILKSFVRTIGQQSLLSDINPKQVVTFLYGTGSVTRTWHNKYQALRNFYSYAISRGHAKTSPLPTTIPKRPPSFVPYIYSRQELRSLLDASFTYQKLRNQVEPYMVRTIILLLYGAGLRIKEAISLTLADVDLPQALLTIRKTKFNKTRLVPLGKQLCDVLSTYAAQRNQTGYSQNPGAFFFAMRNGKAIRRKYFENVFLRIREQSGVCRTDGARYQPRLHDLRHSFVVDRLTTWYKQGIDVQKWLPVLSVYLGHQNLAATSVYLTMTPALLHQANLRFQSYALKEDFYE
ncbi:MAG: tyrosine-type recombinase/integrase [Endomicrobiales bacterium]